MAPIPELLDMDLFVLLPILVVGMFVLVSGLIVWVMLHRRKKMQQAWEGVITRKYSSKDDRRHRFERGEATMYYLYYQTDTGESSRLRVNESLYHSLEIGDRVVKEAGKSPLKVSAAS